MNHKVKGCRSGFSILELVVSIAIILILLAILFPAIQATRKAAKDTLCKNNLHQIQLSLEQLTASRKSLPRFQIVDGQAGGWTVAILPFIDPNYVDQVYSGLTLDSVSSPLPKPKGMTCPFGVQDPDNKLIESSHYVLKVSHLRDFWTVSDTSMDEHLPWVVGEEKPINSLPPMGQGPHYGGYYRQWSNGQLDFIHDQ